MKEIENVVNEVSKDVEVEELTKLTMTGFGWTAKTLGNMNGNISIIGGFAAAAAVASIACYYKGKKQLEEIDRKLEKIEDRLNTK